MEFGLVVTRDLGRGKPLLQELQPLQEQLVTTQRQPVTLAEL